MSTVAEIVERALGRIGRKVEGQSVPAYDQSEGVALLNAMIDQLPEEGVGDWLKLRRVTQSEAISAPSVCHVVAANAVTLTLPENPVDGFRIKVVDVGTDFATNNLTLARNGWLIAGSASDLTISTNGANREFWFRADLGDWVEVMRPLTAASQSPYPAAFDDALTALLAVRWAEDSGADISPQLARAEQDGLARLQRAYMPDLTASFDTDLVFVPSQIPLRNTRVIS